MRKVDLFRTAITNGFEEALKTAFEQEFKGVEITSTFNIVEMSLVTLRTDNADFTPEQVAFIKGFECAHNSAICTMLQADQYPEKFNG